MNKEATITLHQNMKFCNQILFNIKLAQFVARYLTYQFLPLVFHLHFQWKCYLLHHRFLHTPNAPSLNVHDKYHSPSCQYHFLYANLAVHLYYILHIIWENRHQGMFYPPKHKNRTYCDIYIP